MSVPEMAEALSSASGQLISADTYRKWEIDERTPDAQVDVSQLSPLRYELIVHFCDLTRTHPFELLAPVPLDQRGQKRAPQRNEHLARA